MVSSDDNVYEAFPDLTISRDGKLICIFLECKHHHDRSYSRVVLCKSEDRGRTWSKKEPLSERGPGWNCPRISTLKDGRITALCDRGDSEKDVQGRKLFLWRSEDGGKTFLPPVETGIPGFVPDKIIELDDGRWLIASQQYNSKTSFLEQMLYYSDDEGLNWLGPVPVASKKGLHLCEASILKLSSGELVAFMREESRVGRDCYKSISCDGGRTWTGPFRFPLPGCHRPVAGMLKSGMVMITYRFLQGGKGALGWSRQNFFAALTDIESCLSTERNEAHARIMPIDYDRSPVADTGYSGWVQFEDGEIYIVNYIVDDAPKGHIRGYSLEESEFVLK